MPDDNSQVRFADIQSLLDTLVAPNDANIQNAPHQRFWRSAPTNMRDSFVSFDTGNWGQAGPLVTPGDPERSNLYLALSGKPPFDGSLINQMPDVGSDPQAKFANNTQLAVIAAWIKNGAPG